MTLIEKIENLSRRINILRSAEDVETREVVKFRLTQIRHRALQKLRKMAADILKSTANRKRPRPAYTQGDVIKIKKENFLVREKGLVVYKDDYQAEVTVRLNSKRGFIVSMTWFDKDSVKVDITKTINGCPGIRKPDFKKTYRR